MRWVFHKNNSNHTTVRNFAFFLSDKRVWRGQRDHFIEMHHFFLPQNYAWKNISTVQETIPVEGWWRGVGMRGGKERWGGARQTRRRSLKRWDLNSVRPSLCFRVRFILGAQGVAKKGGKEERVGILSWTLRQAVHCPPQCAAALVA